MQSPELYGIVGGNESLLHLLKFQQRTSMKWYLITSLDDTSQVLSHFVHHYLHWILFHMTVGIAGTAKKNSFEISLESLLCSSSSLFNSWDRAWRLGGFRIEPGSQPSQPCRVRQCVASFPSGWQCHDCSAPWFSSQFVFGSPAQLQLNHWTNQVEILANLCKCCTAFASQTNKHQTPPFPPAAGSCSQGGSWTAHTHGPPQSVSLGSANCILFCLHCEDFIWISSKHRV